MRHVNSYDKNAPLPVIDSIWVWEIDAAYARALVQVTEVLWNGEEWWVRTRTLLPRSQQLPGDREKFNMNDLGRFWEACVPVLTKLTGRMDTFSERRPEAAEVAVMREP